MIMLKADVSAAIKALKEGKVIVYPTDTLYGLGADIYNLSAIRKVFEIKKRPTNMPLSIAVSNYDEIKNNAYLNDTAKILINSFLPGKLTLILKKKSLVSDLITADRNKVAIRIPDNKIALEIISKFGPLTATSANIHGKKTPYVINELTMQFRNDVSVYLNDGRLDEPPTTIVDLTTKKPYIIRQGAISINEIMKVI